MQTIGSVDIAFSLATRNGLPGADGLVMEKYNQLMNTGNYGEAAKVAARSPRVIFLKNI